MLLTLTQPLDSEVLEFYQIESNDCPALRSGKLQLVYVRNPPPAAPYILGVKGIEALLPKGVS
jgi:hypothetical protein